MEKIPFAKFIIVLIAILVISGSGYAGWRIWKDTKGIENQTDQNLMGENSEPTTKVNGTETPEIDTSNWKTYQDNQLGIKFKYPPEWGDVRKGTLDLDETDRGEYITFYFTNLAEGHIFESGRSDLSHVKITMTITTSDFKWGGLGPNLHWSGFRGNKEEFKCPPEKEWQYSFNCAIVPDSKFPIISYLQSHHSAGDFLFYFDKHTKILFPHSKYKGVSVDYHIGLYYPTTPQEYQNPTMTFEEYANKTFFDIKNKTIGRETLIRLNQLDTLVESIDFIEG